MPQTSRGTQSHLDSWLYGLVKVTNDLGNARSVLRAVQEETIRKLLGAEPLSFPTQADPADILQAYDRSLGDRGILDADDAAYHRREGGLDVTVGASCPYRGTCIWLHDEGEPLPCFRAIAMAEFLRLTTGRTAEARLTRFGVPCDLIFRALPLEVDDDGN